MEASEKNIFEEQLASLEQRLIDAHGLRDGVPAIMSDAQALRVGDSRIYDIGYGMLTIGRAHNGFVTDTIIKQSDTHHEARYLPN